jgi:AbrB family looped-hinge helix DNA binding protein
VAYTAKVSSRGRITLPAELRRELGINPGDTVVITLRDKSAYLRRQLSLDELIGFFPALPGIETGDFDDLIEEAMSDHADWVVARMREGLECPVPVVRRVPTACRG